jgi:hypothetical protein
MQNKRRNLTICAVIMIATLYAHFPADAWWFHTFVEGEVRVTTWEWFDVGRFAFCAFEFVWGIAVGVPVAALVRSPRPMRWALGCGAVGALAIFGTSTDYFYPATPTSTYIWAYGAYLMPVLGSAFGAWTYLAAVKLHHRSDAHAA